MAVAILAVLTGVMAFTAIKIHHSVLEKRYVQEAESALRAVELYLLDEGGTADSMELIYEITKDELSGKENVLCPYLEGKVTKGAYIQWIVLNHETGAAEELEYCAAGYVIHVERNGTAVIESRPGAAGE